MSQLEQSFSQETQSISLFLENEPQIIENRLREATWADALRFIKPAYLFQKAAPNLILL